MDDFQYEHVPSIAIECKLISKNGRLPSRKRCTDAAYDIYASENAMVLAHGMKNISTGIIIVAPPGFYITTEARSGLGQAGIIPMRGIIDATYTGELKVILINHTTADYKVTQGDRIAQIVLNKQVHMGFDVVEEFGPEYNKRGELGWGSSGK
jgi:dUTP pyrophosphatase